MAGLQLHQHTSTIPATSPASSQSSSQAISLQSTSVESRPVMPSAPEPTWHQSPVSGTAPAQEALQMSGPAALQSAEPQASSTVAGSFSSHAKSQQQPPQQQQSTHFKQAYSVKTPDSQPATPQVGTKRSISGRLNADGSVWQQPAAADFAALVAVRPSQVEPPPRVHGQMWRSPCPARNGCRTRAKAEGAEISIHNSRPTATGSHQSLFIEFHRLSDVAS